MRPRLLSYEEKMDILMENSGGSGRMSKSSSGSNSPISFHYRSGGGNGNSPASRIHPSVKPCYSFSSSASNSPGAYLGPGYTGSGDFAGDIDLALIRRGAASRLARPGVKSPFLIVEAKRVHSPLSPIENRLPPSPPLFKVKAADVGEEGVLVMDGVLVEGKASSGSVKARSWSRSSGSTDSTASSSVAVFHDGLYKTEICRPWEERGSCRYGSHCQYAHGKEELRPSRQPKFRGEAHQEAVQHSNFPLVKHFPLHCKSPNPPLHCKSPSPPSGEVGRATIAGSWVALRMPPRLPLANVNSGGAPAQGMSGESPTSRLAQIKLVEEMSVGDIAVCSDPSLVSPLEKLMARSRRRLPVFEKICPSSDVGMLG